MAKFVPQKKTPRSPWWRIVHNASDKQDSGLQGSVTRTVTELRQGKFGAASKPSWPQFRNSLEGRLSKNMERAAVKSARESAKRLGVSFDEETVRNAARQRAKETAKLITAESRKSASLMRKRLRKEGYSERTINRTLSRSQGLTQGQSNVVVNRMLSAREGGKSVEQQLRAAQKQARISASSRARTVARSEGLAAAQEGQTEVMRAAEREGEIEDVRKVWVTVRDGRQDPICDRLHGQKVKLGTRFRDNSTGRRYSGPPEPHGSCRCGIQFKFRKVRQKEA